MPDEKNLTEQKNTQSNVATAEAPPAAPAEPVFEKKKDKKRAKRIKKIIGWTILAAILVAVGLLVYNLFFKPKPVTINTGIAMTGSIDNSVYGYSPVNAKERAEVVSAAKGEVLELYVENGQKVEKGDPLFLVDSSEYEQTLANAENALKNAQEAYNNAVKKIENLTVTAPISGKIRDVKVKKGDNASEGTTVATIFDDSKMKLKLYFSYAYIDSIKVGQSAVVSIPQTMSKINGEVTGIEKIKKITAEGTVLFEVEITVKNAGALSAGMKATATVASSTGDVMPAETGELAYNDEMNVNLKSYGEVVDVVMKDYYSFNQGDVLMVMENTSLNTAVDSARKDLENAQKEYDRVLEEYESYSPTAPISGTITSLNLAVGDKLEGATSTSLISIANLDTMVINAQIDEKDVGKLSVGMMVQITSNDGENQMSYTGQLTQLALEGKAENGMSYFPATIEIYDAQNLMPNMYVDYNIVATSAENVLTVPSSAIQYMDVGGTPMNVAFVKKGGRDITPLEGVDPAVVPEDFVAVAVEVGISNDQSVEIKSGLQEGDEVALMGAADPSWMQGGGGMMGGGVVMVG
ncbi:efflux RND transporter periplasmic adaptor subunit [Feifania hominis]|uniref:HlyD family efflux transporter periplasmic adaptor subunit n=1 Tax=Feifania hominis TaxID=2763660 RepID=A0A926DDU4_9FIRM|nr:HlyD family efflux transporter periplasmic adaptor subunit [Feifania hominis]MBC8536022.1 HlyD family efflux transporter periplasmic adaptor subunit [Feifania hominis]